ncbi:Galanin receptor type 2 [Merluccius polli]|uniref:Galanin receptor type 2 n=1 Tax=Merluccius polli TaxID=89951 RepID=A0AA47P4G7_MERPO|nr:Galanin receptor type 2 [Merluccius polli]
MVNVLPFRGWWWRWWWGLVIQAVTNIYGLIFACTCGLILCVGLGANLLVFLLFAKHNSLRRNRLDVLLLSMTLADFLTLLLIPFTLHSAISQSWPLGDVFCKVYQFLLAFSMAASTYSLCAVSVTRAMIITNPHRPPPHMDLVALMFALVWALSFLISLPLRMFATKESIGPSPGLANFTYCLPTIHEHHYQVVLSQFVLFYFAPMLVIAFNYARLALFLHRSPVMSLASARNTRRASLMVFLAAGSFSACWLPGYVLELCVYLGLYRHGLAWETFYFACTVLQYLHPCVNPVLYVLLSKRYRHRRAEWLFGCAAGNRVHPQVTSIATDSL